MDHALWGTSYEDCDVESLLTVGAVREAQGRQPAALIREAQGRQPAALIREAQGRQPAALIREAQGRQPAALIREAQGRQPAALNNDRAPDRASTGAHGVPLQVRRFQSSEETCRATARLLAEGQGGRWLQGKVEWGAPAPGTR